MRGDVSRRDIDRLYKYSLIILSRQEVDMEHEWRVKRPVLHLFNQGKELEIRVKARFFEDVRPGDSIVFNQEVRRRVIAVRRYSSFKEMLGNEDVQKILPGRSASETLILLQQIYPFEQERRGVYVFELAREVT